MLLNEETRNRLISYYEARKQRQAAQQPMQQQVQQMEQQPVQQQQMQQQQQQKLTKEQVLQQIEQQQQQKLTKEQVLQQIAAQQSGKQTTATDTMPNKKGIGIGDVGEAAKEMFAVPAVEVGEFVSDVGATARVLPHWLMEKGILTDLPENQLENKVTLSRIYGNQIDRVRNADNQEATAYELAEEEIYQRDPNNQMPQEERDKLVKQFAAMLMGFARGTHIDMEDAIENKEALQSIVGEVWGGRTIPRLETDLSAFSENQQRIIRSIGLVNEWYLGGGTNALSKSAAKGIFAASANAAKTERGRKLIERSAGLAQYSALTGSAALLGNSYDLSKREEYDEWKDTTLLYLIGLDVAGLLGTGVRSAGAATARRTNKDANKFLEWLTQTSSTAESERNALALRDYITKRKPRLPTDNAGNELPGGIEYQQSMEAYNDQIKLLNKKNGIEGATPEGIYDKFAAVLTKDGKVPTEDEILIAIRSVAGGEKVAGLDEKEAGFMLDYITLTIASDPVMLKKLPKGKIAAFDQFEQLTKRFYNSAQNEMADQSQDVEKATEVLSKRTNTGEYEYRPSEKEFSQPDVEAQAVEYNRAQTSDEINSMIDESAKRAREKSEKQYAELNIMLDEINEDNLSPALLRRAGETKGKIIGKDKIKAAQEMMDKLATQEYGQYMMGVPGLSGKMKDYLQSFIAHASNGERMSAQDMFEFYKSLRQVANLYGTHRGGGSNVIGGIANEFSTHIKSVLNDAYKKSGGTKDLNKKFEDAGETYIRMLNREEFSYKGKNKKSSFAGGEESGWVEEPDVRQYSFFSKTGDNFDTRSFIKILNSVNETEGNAKKILDYVALEARALGVNSAKAAQRLRDFGTSDTGLKMAEENGIDIIAAAEGIESAAGKEAIALARESSAETFMRGNEIDTVGLNTYLARIATNDKATSATLESISHNVYERARTGKIDPDEVDTVLDATKKITKESRSKEVTKELQKGTESINDSVLRGVSEYVISIMQKSADVTPNVLSKDYIKALKYLRNPKVAKYLHNMNIKDPNLKGKENTNELIASSISRAVLFGRDIDRKDFFDNYGSALKNLKVKSGADRQIRNAFALRDSFSQIEEAKGMAPGTMLKALAQFQDVTGIPLETAGRHGSILGTTWWLGFYMATRAMNQKLVAKDPAHRILISMKKAENLSLKMYKDLYEGLGYRAMNQAIRAALTAMNREQGQEEAKQWKEDLKMKADQFADNFVDDMIAGKNWGEIVEMWDKSKQQGEAEEFLQNQPANNSL